MNAPRAGPNQHDPTDPHRSVWVSANAGAGKTRVLVDRVARLLLAGTLPERILCLTFTKAAATEMANRLHQRLGQWALMSDNALAEALEELRIVPPLDGQLLSHARRLFARALETPGGLKIQTIHAFCERLLGRFPIEAGIAPHFNVLDERSAAELLHWARDDVLMRLATTTDPVGQERLALLAGRGDENALTEILNRLLAQRAAFEAMESRYSQAGRLEDAVYQAAEIAPGTRADTLLAEFVDGLPRTDLARVKEALATGKKSDRERAALIAAMLDSEHAQHPAEFDAYRLAFLSSDNEPRQKLVTADLARDNPWLIAVLAQEQSRVSQLQDQLQRVRCAELSLAALSVGRAVLGRYGELKSAQAALDYDDLIRRTLSLLTRGHAAAWVLFKLDGGLDHILVDEAQDTSPDQWRVIEALADEFFTGVGARPLQRTVFAVGDEKQSIYSFQGADPDSFDAMRAHFAKRAKEAQTGFSSLELIDSYRSTEPVLALVDRLFAMPERAKALAKGARSVHHGLKRKGHAGLVELWPTEKPDPNPKPDPWMLPLDYESPQSPRARLAQRIAELVAGSIESGERLASADRPIRPGDILILVRKRDRFVEDMIRMLKLKSIPVAGSDRLQLTEHIAVMDLLAVASFAVMPDDDLTLATVLKCPLVGLSEDALFTLAFNRDQYREGSLWQALCAHEGADYAQATRFLKDLLDSADQATPHAFFAGLLGASGGRARLVARLGPDANDPIDELERLTLVYEELHPPSLQGFLQWLSSAAVVVKRDMEQGRDEVRVMTVHGAKGLEAPIVILPDTCTLPHRRARPDFVPVQLGSPETTPPVLLWSVGQKHDPPALLAQRATLFDNAHAEHLRLLYVALTRACDRLYVCGYEGKTALLGDSWYKLIEDAMTGFGQAVTATDGTVRLVLRTDQTAAPKPEREGVPIRGPIEALPPWAHQRPTPEPEQKTTLSPSALGETDGAEPPLRSPLEGGDSRRTRFLRGRLIHRLLEALPGLDPASREVAARRFLAEPVHDLSAEEIDDIASSALGVLSDPAFADLFGPISRAEVPVIGDLDTADGPRRVFGIVDRLAVSADRVMVVDYKTNRPPPRTVAQVPMVYRRQLAAYRAVLRSVYRNKTVVCALLWTEGPHLLVLPDPVLDEALEAMSIR